MTWAGTKILLAKFMAGATGLEPATFGVTGRTWLRRSIAQEKAASAPPKKGRKRIEG